MVSVNFGYVSIIETKIYFIFQKIRNLWLIDFCCCRTYELTIAVCLNYSECRQKFKAFLQ